MDDDDFDEHQIEDLAQAFMIPEENIPDITELYHPDEDLGDTEVEESEAEGWNGATPPGSPKYSLIEGKVGPDWWIRKDGQLIIHHYPHNEDMSEHSGDTPYAEKESDWGKPKTAWRWTNNFCNAIEVDKIE